MKINVLFAGILISLFLSCKSETDQKSYALNFGLCEIPGAYDMSDTFSAKLIALNMQLADSAAYPVIGYSEDQSDSLLTRLSEISTESGICFAFTANTVDDEGKYFALVALADFAFISNSDVQEAVNLENRVEIRFNRQGAVKWAKMTESNLGHQVAFVVDKEIYCMPLIAGVIRSGTALITGLSSEDAERIAAGLNND